MEINKKFKKIVKKVDKINLHVFSEPILRNMYQEINNKQNELLNALKQIDAQIEILTNQSNGHAILIKKDSAKKIKTKFNELNDEKDKIWKVLQGKILENRLIEKFKYKWLVNLKETLIMGLIMFVLGLLYYDLTHPNLSLETRKLFFYLDTGACFIFLTNFFYELRLADSKKWYWKTHWIDFVTSIPLPDAGLLRGGRAARLARLARLARVVRFLRVLRLIFFFWRGMDKLAEVLDVKLMKKSFISGIIVLCIGGVIIFFVEQDQGSGVSTLRESIWWSFTTLVTGGFGDLHNPQSGTGRILTIILIISGMILVGVFTATLTSILVVDDDSEKIEQVKIDLLKRIDELSKQLGKEKKPLERKG
jgi:voltage-gated potassium channel